MPHKQLTLLIWWRKSTSAASELFLLLESDPANTKVSLSNQSDIYLWGREQQALKLRFLHNYRKAHQTSSPRVIGRPLKGLSFKTPLERQFVVILCGGKRVHSEVDNVRYRPDWLPEPKSNVKKSPFPVPISEPQVPIYGTREKPISEVIFFSPNVYRYRYLRCTGSSGVP
jgi:hypothetical protein